jgi:hypothetical protein
MNYLHTYQAMSNNKLIIYNNLEKAANKQIL